MKKLTLSAEPCIIKAAKEIAREEGATVSKMFDRFIRLLMARRKQKREPGPLTKQAMGLFSLPPEMSDRDALQEALSERYGLKK